MAGLDEIVREPGLIDRLTLDQRRTLLVRATVAAALLASRLDDETGGVDGLMSVEDAATMLAVAPNYLYRRKNLPFMVQVGPGAWRCSKRGIERYIRANTGG